MEADPEGWVSSPLSAIGGLPPSCAGYGIGTVGNFRVSGHRTQDTAQDSTGHRPVRCRTREHQHHQHNQHQQGLWPGAGDMPCLGCLFLRSHPLRPGTLTYPVTRPSPLELSLLSGGPPLAPAAAWLRGTPPSDPLPSHRGRLRNDTLTAMRSLRQKAAEARCEEVGGRAWAQREMHRPQRASWDGWGHRGQGQDRGGLSVSLRRTHLCAFT